MYDDIVVVNFSGTDVHRRLQEEFFKLYGSWFHSGLGYTLDGIKQHYPDFYNNNLHLFKYKKYSGYFIWKPFIIQKTMELYPDKFILYCDSNIRFRDFSKIYDCIHNKNYFFIGCHNFINKHWTKRDTFVFMDMDEEKYWDAHQIWTSLMGFRNTHEIQSLFSVYTYYCSKEICVTDQPNTLGKNNLDGFREHRWEQSVMSLLIKNQDLHYEWDYMFIPGVVDKIYPIDLQKQKVEENAIQRFL